MKPKRLDIAYGSNKRAAPGAPGKLIAVEGADHFTILEALRRPDGILVDAARRLLD
ncbi:hypothetical protein [Bradyrhizobium sp. LMG 9283]|uniref:hypothetical protein n=1 Tax=Bradyrhizobium sp. LMG 9283 TaxID=592064 RepID=UPI003890A985